MRRTTICRSKASVTFALTVVAFAAPAPAQNPPPQTPPAGQPAAPLAPLPPVHVVQAGETLWSLAMQYFGDPLLWPEIYRLNTNVVEDPHWIYPGEELRLSGDDVIAAEPAPGQPTVVAVTPDADTTQRAPAQPVAPRGYGPTIFSPQNRAGAASAENLEFEAARAYRAVREGEYYSAAFLTEGVPLATGRLLGNLQASAIRRLSTSSSAQLFTEVAIEPPANDSLRPGDLMLAVRRTGDIRGFGDVVVPTGLLRVTAVTADRAAARVVAMYGAVTDGQEVLRVAPYPASAAARAVDVSDGLTGQVVGLVKPGDVMNLQDGVFINLGVQEGVRLGDVFLISGTDRARNDFNDVVLPQAQVLVVNVRPHTATAIIVQLQRPDVRAGSTVRQIRRMPS